MSFKNSQTFTRRRFIGTGSATSAGLVAGFIRPQLWSGDSPVSRFIPDQMVRDTLNDPAAVRAMALAAIDTARAAGAEYADARLSRTVTQDVYNKLSSRPYDWEELSIGVRVMVDGAWGFASSSYWNIDEASILARAAVQQARINSNAHRQDIDMGSYPVVNGSWSTPIRIDPFKIPYEEKQEFVMSIEGTEGGLTAYSGELRPRRVPDRIIKTGTTPTKRFTRQEVATATTEGSYFTQTFYSRVFGVQVGIGITQDGRHTGRGKSLLAKGSGTYAGGWDSVLDANFREQIPELIEKIEAGFLDGLRGRMVDVGRYTVVLDAVTTGRLLGATLGKALQLDNALGLEANSGGTSFLGPDPMEYLGTEVASSMFTLKGDRTLEGGLATARWDEEGVETKAFDMISNGTLVDYQTTREQAAWLSPWYQKQGLEVKSNACSRVATAIDMPLQFSPNLVMSPGTDTGGFDELVASVSKGMALIRGVANTDFQARTGLLFPEPIYGKWREIVDGKLGDEIGGAAMMFDSSELWKTLINIGDANSAEYAVAAESKGEPEQSREFSIVSVPVIFKDAAIIDPMRRA